MQGIPEELASLSDLLRCPHTGQKLRIASPVEVRALAGYDADGFLVREDGTAAYPVCGGIPSLLPESLITLSLGPNNLPYFPFPNDRT